MIDHLSYSSLAAYRRCPRLWFYRYVLNRTKAGPTAKLMAAGAALHAATAEWWRSRNLLAARNALAREWEERMVAGAPRALARPGAMTGDDRYSYMTVEHLYGVLDTYVEADPLRGFSLCTDTPTNWEGVERIDAHEDAGLSEAEIRIRLYDGLPPFELRLDALMEDESGRLHLIDRKCKSGWLNDYSIRLSIGVGHQLRLYQTVVERLLGRSIYATWIEGIYMGEPPKSGWARVKSEPWGLFGPWHNDSELLAETEEWARGTWADIEVAVERGSCYYDGAGDPQAFAQNDAGGCPNCEYFSLCELPPSSRAGAIEAEYEVRRVEEEETEDE